MSDDPRTFEAEYVASEPVPIDGIDLRDAIATDRQARAHGTLERELAERMAIEDLTLVDAFERDKHEPANIPTWPDAVEDLPEPVQAKEIAADKGGRFERRGFAEDAKPEETLANINQLRRDALVERINILLQTEGDELQYPRYGAQVRDEWIDWTLCRRKYKFCITQKQRDQIYYRRMEDIADQSNGHPHLPNWYIR